MGIPLAAQGLRTPQFKSPLDQMTKAVHLKSLLQGQQINQFNLQQAQRGAQQQQQTQQQAQQAQARMQALFIRADGKLEKMIELAPQAGIGMEAYQGLVDRRTKRRQELQKMTLDDLKIGREKSELLGRSVSAILSLPADQRPQATLQAIPSLVEDPEEAQQYQQLAQLPPEQLEQTLNMFRLLGVDSTEQFKAEEKRKAEKAKLTTKEKDFQAFYKPYRESKSLPRNAKIEMQARNAFAKQSRAAAINLNFPSALKPVEPGQKREEILAQLDPPTRELIVGITNYKLSPARVTSIRGGRRERIIGLAMMYDPSFDMSQYPARQKLRADFTSGKGAANLRSLNTAIGHLDSLGRSADKLDNSPIQLWNKIANFTLAQTGDPRIVEFNNTANAVAGEMATIFKNTSGTDQEIKAWREQLSSSQSPEQIHGAINQLIELMASRMEALAGQWQSGMGKPKDFRFLNDKSEKILREFGAGAESLLELDRIGAREAAGGVSGGAPSAGGGMVTMIAPDGSEAEVPRENVEAAIAAGAKIKGQ